MKRLLALLLTLALMLSLLPSAIAAAPKAQERDIWDVISEIEAHAATRANAADADSLTAAYSGTVDEIIEAVTSSSSYVPGTLERHGDFFFWVDAKGDPNGYSPRLRAELRANAIPGANPDALGATKTVSFEEKGGWAGSVDVAAIQPYIGIDSSFTAQYENECYSIAQATGGTGTAYQASNATITAIGDSISTCGVVIFDSHGTTDYSGYDGYTSHANSSYLCLTSGTGITTEDKASAQGQFGTYYHAFNSGGTWCVDGTAIANHVSTDSPNGLLWMAICLGMATDGLQAPLRAKGVEVVYGYSQSVSFTGDYAYERYFFDYMKDGRTVAEAAAYMKQRVGNKDPYTNPPAYPIFADSEDVYPGHGNVDAVQPVYSTWTLYSQFTINAVSNNTEWGTVQLSGRNITATPNTGYYVKDYTVLEGTATVTRNGNVFTVDAQTDCTVQINFAPRDPAVVHFSVPEGVSCAEINAYVGDEVTLPMPQGDPAIESRNFHFLGWVAAPTEEDTQDLPAFLNAGKKISLTEADVTYYALYSYYVMTDSTAVDDQFHVVDKAPGSWVGEYVITCDGAFALGATADCLGSNVNNRLGIEKAVKDLAEMGITREGDFLNNVTDDVTYVVEPAENGTYSIKMKNENQYLAMAADSDSLTTYSSSNSAKTRWTISFGSNGPVLTNAQFPSRVLQYDTEKGVFKCFTGGKKGLTLFTKAEGEYWYTTNPAEVVVCEVHSFGDWVTDTEPSCLETGSKHHSCTVCGFTETEEIEALGHDYAAVVTEPTCTEAGFTTYTCSRCNDSYTGDEAEALGHDWGEGAVTVEPSYQASGVKTFTCARCGETRTEEIEKLANPFEDVHDEDFFFNPVMWALDETVTGGIDETHFAPEKTVMRADAMVFFWAANGRPEFTATDKTFKDVKKKHWAYSAVMWAVENGITAGTDEARTYFSPQRTCTRSEILQFLYAAMGSPEYTIENPYSDVKDKHWYKDGAIWAYEKGLERGENGKFQAKTPCTRGYVVTYLYRYFTGNELAE